MKINQGFIIFFTIPLKQYELYSFELTTIILKVI